jgi:hypothetical protein
LYAAWFFFLSPWIAGIFFRNLPTPPQKSNGPPLTLFTYLTLLYFIFLCCWGVEEFGGLYNILYILLFYISRPSCKCEASVFSLKKIDSWFMMMTWSKQKHTFL